jgi:ligand-binding sensor domain-containing protein
LTPNKLRHRLAWLAAPLLAACLPVRAERLPIKVYTTADGLGSSAINWILRDSRGFLWFGTRDGLSRFDGQRFTTYHVGQSKSPSVSQIIERRRGDYLVTLQSGELYRFDARTPASSAGDAPDGTLTLHADQLADDVGGWTYEDRSGNLWVAGTQGLFLLTGPDQHLVFQPVELRPPGQNAATNVSRIIEARDGSLWLTTNLGLMRRAPDGRVMLYGSPAVSPISNSLTGLCEDRDGRIWVGSRDGVYVLQPPPLSDPSAFAPRSLADAARGESVAALPSKAGDIFEFTADRPDELVFAIYQTSDGRLWLTKRSGLSLFDGHSFRSFTAANGVIASPGVMAEDADNNLWLGTLDGALKLATRGFITYGKDDGLGAPMIRSIYGTPAGDLYVVGSEWQVSRLDGSRFETVRPQLPDAGLPLWNSNVAFLDSNYTWWFLSERRLFRFDRAQRLEALKGRPPSAVYETGPDFHDGSFYRMFEDSRGRVWVGTRTTVPARMGLTVFDRATDTFHALGAAEGFPDDRAPSAFCEDRAGGLWFGFYQGGVARYAGGKFTLLTSGDGLPDVLITDIHSDRAGRLWIASVGGGLIRVDDPAAARPALVSYTTANGLSSDNVRAITEDEEGRIYLGTVRGVDRLSPDTGRVKHYTTADGLADDFVTVAFRDRTGTLWFGTQNGLSRLTPETSQPSSPPPVFIGGLRVAGVKQSLSELGEREVGQLQLNYTQADLQIDFFSLGFAPAEHILYQYRLEGADNYWRAPTGERSVTFANLAPGTYRFLVRAVNADGLTSREPAVVSFRIAPPFWSRWWFTAAVILLFGAGVYAFARASFRRKLELERVRTRIAADLHDDIGASLTRIVMLSEVAQRQGNGAQPVLTRRLTQITDDARAVVDSMGDIVWSIDPRRDDLLSVVERARSFAVDTLGSLGVHWRMTVAPQLAAHRLTPEQRRALYLIFKEAINNIARHSGCRNASCQITFERSTLVALIEDDGRGLQAERAGNGRGGRGLSNMKERAEEIGGRLEVGPREGGGTRLTLTLPLRSERMNMFSWRRRV